MTKSNPSARAEAIEEAATPPAEANAAPGPTWAAEPSRGGPAVAAVTLEATPLVTVLVVVDVLVVVRV